MEQWIPRYETLSQLNESSLFLVRNGLKRFMDEYGPFSWPIDCFRLLCDIQRSGRIQLYVVESSGLPGGVDARTWYFAACGYYLMIRKSVPENWQAQSGSRRCNFTMAHELGHIFLGHLDVPEDAKSEALRSRENAEADEFASRLLMPEDLVLNACFPAANARTAVTRFTTGAGQNTTGRATSTHLTPGSANPAASPPCMLSWRKHPGLSEACRFMIYSAPPVNSMFSLTIHHILRCRSNIRQRFQIS